MKSLLLKIVPIGALLALLLFAMSVTGCDISPVPTPIPGEEGPGSPIPNLEASGDGTIVDMSPDTIEPEEDVEDSDTTEDFEETDSE